MSEKLLEVEGLHVFLGKHHILQGVSFHLRAGERTVLIGRNGAGKTTTLRAIMGLLPLSQGKVVFAGQSIHNKRPFEIARLGIGFVPEDRGLFQHLTVEENFRVAMLYDDKVSQERLQAALEIFPDLRRFWKSRAGNLSGGQKQMLAIARPLVNENKLLLIDEPSKGLAPIVIDNLILALKKLSRRTVVILVEQNFYMASSLGTDFFILDGGRTVHAGRMEDLVNNQEMKEKYLGISG